MPDKTTYTIESRDSVNRYHNPDDGNWDVVYGQAYDTFSDAVDDLDEYLNTYREVRIVKHERTVVSSYKDGLANG